MTTKGSGISTRLSSAILAFLLLAGIVNAEELLAFNWNGVIDQTQKFAKVFDSASMQVNWKNPKDYVNGTIYMRAEVVESQPKPQMGMKMQWCVWQNKPNGGFREACGKMKTVPGKKGTVVTWSQKVPDMYNRKNNPILWDQPRDRSGIAVKDAAGKPLYRGQYQGHDPKDWFPFRVHWMTVVVEKGKVFSGWDKYVKGTGIRQNFLDKGFRGVGRGNAYAIGGVRFTKSGGNLVVESPGNGQGQIDVLDINGCRILRSQMRSSRIVFKQLDWVHGILFVRVKVGGKAFHGRMLWLGGEQ